MSGNADDCRLKPVKDEPIDEPDLDRVKSEPVDVDDDIDGFELTDDIIAELRPKRETDELEEEGGRFEAVAFESVPTTSKASEQSIAAANAQQSSKVAFSWSKKVKDEPRFDGESALLATEENNSSTLGSSRDSAGISCLSADVATTDKLAIPACGVLDDDDFIIEPYSPAPVVKSEFACDEMDNEADFASDNDYENDEICLISVENTKENVESQETNNDEVEIKFCDVIVPDDHHVAQKRLFSENTEPRMEEDLSSSQELQNQDEAEEPVQSVVADTEVVLDNYISDLNLKITDDNLRVAEPIATEGFAFLHAGVKARYGVWKGKVAYEVRLLENLPASHLSSEERFPHVLRVGWSVEDAPLQLGEFPYSYGYSSTGRSCENGKFRMYGQSFCIGDVITALLDFEKMKMFFLRNGNRMGTAFMLKRPPGDNTKFVLFPHILSKNIKFEVNFGQNEEPWFEIPDNYKDYLWLNDVPLLDRQRLRNAPETKQKCVVLMLCGLPGCGKTTWISKFLAYDRLHGFHRDWNILGSTQVLDRMSVEGTPRRKNYCGRWDVLMGIATKIVGRLMQIASKRRRNYILDQTNVLPQARQRKMVLFKEFFRKAIVIVPRDDDYVRRYRKQEQEEGKQIPHEAIFTMKAAFTLPELAEDLYDEIEYAELPKSDALIQVTTYNEDGRNYQAPPQKKLKGGKRGSLQQQPQPEVAQASTDGADRVSGGEDEAEQNKRKRNRRNQGSDAKLKAGRIVGNLWQVGPPTLPNNRYQQNQNIFSSAQAAAGWSSVLTQAVVPSSAYPPAFPVATVSWNPAIPPPPIPPAQFIK